MNRKKRYIFPVMAAIVAIVVLVVIFGMQEKPAYVEEVSAQKKQDAFELLSDSLDFGTTRYQEYLANQRPSMGWRI